MTMDRTLKTHGGAAGVRSVLKRAERIGRLIDEGAFDPEKDDPLGLPKTKVRHSKAGTKTKKAEEKPALAEGAVAGAEGEAPAAAGAEAAPAKGAAAKGAAPAAKAPAAKAAAGKAAGKEKG